MNWLRSGIAILTLLVVLGSVGWSIQQKEATLADGRTILLPMGPRDPRSLMQGDYMRLNYDPSLFPSKKVIETLSYKGFVILTLDDKQQATFARMADGEPISSAEIRVRYRRAKVGWRNSGIKYAADSFFFEEGQASRFSDARFVMVQVGLNGETVLTGLANADGGRISSAP
jgi:uncharacterized membrane-anchored protein